MHFSILSKFNLLFFSILFETPPLSFADEPTFEDVNEQIDVFAVMQLARYHLLRYIQKNKLSYFYFHASTARKARIYPRFSARLIQDLPNYNFCQENQSFYFFKKA